MKKLLLFPFLFLLSIICYAQEDTAVIRKAFDFMNSHQQNIADSIMRPLTAEQFPKEKYYRSYRKRKEQSDKMYLNASFIPCSTYYVYDSTISGISGKTYPKYIFHSKHYTGQGYVSDGTKYKLFYTFYFMDSRHFNVIKVHAGPEVGDCSFYYNEMIFGTSETFIFELNANNELVLRSAYKITHN